jgi:hypothetical protein
MSENTLATNEMNDATDAAISTDGNQAQANKTYSQSEVDNMMARMRGSLEKKLLKPYEDLGDPTELRTMKQQAEAKAQADAIKRGEFEKTLQDLAAKKDAEIQKRDSVIKEYKVNTPLLSAAAQYRAVNAEQVKSLLSQNVRLNADGEVEVVDNTGAVRYNDKGAAIDVNDLVKEFLDANPHFVSATPATTNTKSAHTNTISPGVDISKLDMKKPEHRKLYAAAQAKAK